MGVTDPNDVPFRVRVLADGVRIILPRRQLGMMRLMGLLPLLFGMAFSGFAVFWMIGASGAMWGSNGQFQWWGVPFTLFGVPFVLVGLVPIGFGLAVLVGRSEIDVRRDMLISRERIGPMWWSKQRSHDDLNRLEFVNSKGDESSSPMPGALANVGAIVARFTNQKQVILAIGYPLPMLRALTELLRQEVDSIRPGGVVVGDSGIAIEEIEDDESGDGSRSRRKRFVSRPSGTDILLDQTPDGITLTVPPAGYFKGSKGLGCMAIFWILFMAVFSSITVIGPIARGGVSGVDWIFLLFNVVFWTIGIGIFIGALSMGRRRAIIDVVGDTVLITRQGLRGVKQHQWSRDQLKDIRIGPSGMSVNDKPVNELQFDIAGEKKVGMFASRTDDEIEWMVSVLCEQLQLKSHDDTDWPSKDESG